MLKRCRCGRQCLLNVVADSTTGVLGFVILAKDAEGRGQLFRTIGRVFGGFSDTAKAFIIIASTDILLGCEAHGLQNPFHNLTITSCSVSAASATCHCTWTHVSHCKTEVSC